MITQRVKKITFRDTAHSRTVSAQTVSRVINNRPDVADKTRKAVKESIDRVHYQPSARARGFV